jgi:uncharacterized protein YijF (DUF1287 family)
MSNIFRTFAEIKLLNSMKRILLLFVAVIAFSLLANAKVPCGFRELTEEEMSFWIHRKDSIVDRLVNATLSIVDNSIIYDPSYVKIDYPMGDVPANTGVCSDVVIRAFRKGLDRDLQKEIYDFRKWQRDEQGYNITIDRNIDHRRVRNIMEMWDLVLDANGTHTDWDGTSGRDLTKCERGDIIVFDLGGGVLHIAICISDKEIVHNICCGQVVENINNYSGCKIIRNYRLWEPPKYMYDGKK